MQSAHWILGLNHGPHDSSATLLRNGKLIVIAEQERFSRSKHAFNQPPTQAMKYCLDYAGISLGELESVALGFDFVLMRKWLGIDAAQALRELPFDDPDRLFPASVFGKGERPLTQAIRHHTAHAASTFWASGFADAAVLVADGMGEAVSTTLGYGSADGFSVIETYPVSQSLGMYYSRAALYAGLYDDRSSEVGKLMGLAAYGRPQQPMPLSAQNGRYEFTGLPPMSEALPGSTIRRERSGQLLAFFERHCYPFTSGLAADVMSYASFAASVQAALEGALLELARELRRRTGARNLALAGGVALNCTANGVLARGAGYDNVYIQPMAGDSGVALGAAIAAHAESHGTGTLDVHMEHACYGPSYQQDEIETALLAQGVAFSRYPETQLIARVAELIDRGAVVGWYQGRAEVGPRALGARSLLGDPRRRETLVRLNQIKGREMWRPIAPSVLAGEWEQYFTGARPDPFMIVATTVRPTRRAVIPAVVHVDGSARPQAVSPRALPRYAALIAEFGRRTGVPVLANTSFNLHDEPIVNTPLDAVCTYLRGQLDVLAIGDCLVVRPGAEVADAPAPPEAHAWW
jgi:carbamoyltransferase